VVEALKSTSMHVGRSALEKSARKLFDWAVREKTYQATVDAKKESKLRRLVVKENIGST